MRKFYEVFDDKVEIDKDIYEKVKNAEIASLEVNKEKRAIRLYLVFDEIIHASVLKKLKTEMLNELKGITDIIIRIKYNFDETVEIKRLIRLYWDNILHSIEDISPVCSGILENAKWKLEGSNLNINISEAQGCYVDYKKLDLEIEKMLSEELGFKIKVNFITSEKEEKYDREKEEREIIDKIMKENKANINSKSNSIKETVGNILLGRNIKEPSAEIDSIQMEERNFVVEGVAINTDEFQIKSGKYIFSMDLTDFTNSVTVKSFIKAKKYESIKKKFKKGMWYKVKGNIQYDTYNKELVLMARHIMIIDSKETVKEDNAKEKRVELHTHTKMSAMDAVVDVKNLITRAKRWGHKAVAITDHGNVQSFPDIDHATDKDDENFKPIYGLEAYLVDDLSSVVQSSNNQNLDDEYVIFDLETTGFNPGKDKITEIGAVKIKNGEVIDQFSSLVNPEMRIPDKIVDITGITDEMVRDKKTIKEVLPKFLEFTNQAVMVAHNADFDMKFIRFFAKKYNFEVKNTVLDTVSLARTLYPKIKNHKLGTIAKFLDVDLENHHRAVDDANATAEIFLKCVFELKKRDINTLDELNVLGSNFQAIKKKRSNHAIILVKTQEGMKNLYKLVSKSHIDYFYRKPRIPKSEILKHREGLILGSACEAGELYKAILENKPTGFINNIVKFYDYLEIQPLGNNEFMLRNGKVESEKDLENINKEIVRLGEKFNKPVVATCDVHFMDADDEVYRRIIMAGQGFKDADEQPPLYFRTTNEMLKEFEYLGQEKAYEVVVKNTNLVADLIDDGIRAISSEKCPPKIEGSDEEFREMTYKKAKSIYGDPLPELVKERLDNEVESIIENGYAVMYIIAQKLVKKSMEEGYLVGSRGSVGSSFAATMADITEVNPLPPHYVCPECKFSDFDSEVPKSFAGNSGCDMPDRKCPKCGAELKKDGHDIPFETFLGFGGNKEPDIDLNFSGEYQSKAHDYTEELFGKGKTYRAGTIGTMADKTAYGFIKKYLDERERHERKAEINRLIDGCLGVKRSTGQHPGGIVVVPDDKEITDFCPINWPANDNSVSLPTTHFDFHSIEYNLLKLDILGHDDPTMIRRLEDITGVDAQEIPFDEPKVLSLFKSPEALGITSEDINGCITGSLGVPEFGTSFVIQMLVDTKPEHFSDLVRISGLSHGTDVWLNNAQELVRKGTCTISEVISTRDDIMVYLINKGMEKELAFRTMEDVRKGRGLKEEQEKAMKEVGVPDWYIWSCKQIKYMFPKAHAVAYVMMAFRIAYFKVYHPAAYYACYFGIRAKAFDYEIMAQGSKVLEKEDRYLRQKDEKKPKDKALLEDIKVVREMYARGFEFTKIDLYKAKAEEFILTEDDKIMPSFNTIQGLGNKAALRIVEARKEGEFISIEEFKQKTGVSKNVIEILRKSGIFEGMPETSQMSLF